MQVLVLGDSTFPFHDIDEKRPAFAAALADFDVTVTDDRDALVGEYDVLVDYLTDSTLTDDQQAAVLAHVDAGGGYVGVHCAADLTSRTPDGSEASADRDEVIAQADDPIPELRELLGGQFLDHPERSEFGVEVVADHPITAGVAEFRVYDEPYQVTADDDVEILARMAHPDLPDYPVVWTHEAAGRVAYVSLGHTDEALRQGPVQRLLANAVAWAGE